MKKILSLSIVAILLSSLLNVFGATTKFDFAESLGTGK
jgi:hypothetical protein